MPTQLQGMCSIVGLRGVGKSALATLISLYYNNIKKIPVFSNFEIQGCFEFDVSDIGKYRIEDCIIILDEAGIDLNNRKIMLKSMKGITEDSISWWKKSRHHGCKNVYIFSQAFDYDVTLRRLCSRQFICTTTVLPNWSKLIPLKEEWAISDDGMDPVLHLVMPRLPLYLFFWRVPAYGLYDSYDRMKLPFKDFVYHPYIKDYSPPRVFKVLSFYKVPLPPCPTFL